MSSFYNAKCTVKFEQSGATIKSGQKVKAFLILPPKQQKNKSPATWSIEGIAGEITSVLFAKHFIVPHHDYMLN